MAVVASGSIAFDYILTFKGRFRDHILLDKTHVLNLSFLVDELTRRRGGVAGNYAHTLALLGCPCAILATAGADADEYRRWMEERGVDCRGWRVIPDEVSATGFTTTDLDDNQLTGYYSGAMKMAGSLGLADTVPNPEALIVGPNAPDAMARLVREARSSGVRWVFDPAHQLPHLSAADLIDGARGAWILIGNDYEMELITQRTRRSIEDLLEICEVVVVTLGRLGSRIHTRSRTYETPPAPARREADPTGAGDAYRAGLVFGLLRGLPPESAGRVASLSATYAVEQPGTIEHTYTLAEFAERYRDAFGEELPDELRT